MKIDHLEVVTKMAEKVIESEGLSLFDIEYKKEGRRKILRIFIDNPKGVSLEDCEYVSRQLSQLLDVEEPFDEPYILEVSTPGMDRKLRHEENYSRYIGKLVKIKTAEKINGEKVFKARLINFENGVVYLEDKKGKKSEIPYASVLEGRLEVEF